MKPKLSVRDPSDKQIKRGDTFVFFYGSNGHWEAPELLGRAPLTSVSRQFQSGHHPSPPIAPGPIYMTVPDMKRLIALIREHREEGRGDPRLDVLKEELLRALVMDAERRLASDVVTFDSRVVVADLDSGEETTFTLVMPSESDDAEGRMSVLSPSGWPSSAIARARKSSGTCRACGGASWFRKVLHQPEAAARRKAASDAVR